MCAGNLKNQGDWHKPASIARTVRAFSLKRWLATSLLGTSLFHLGQLAASWVQIGQAASSSDGPSHGALALFAGPDVGVFCRAYESHLLCQFGHAEQAVTKSDESIAQARDVSHPFALGIALDYAAMLNVHLRDSKRALARAGEASAVCRKYGFVYYLAIAEIVAGWATAMEGNTTEGVAQLRHGLESLKATGAELRLPFYLWASGGSLWSGWPIERSARKHCQRVCVPLARTANRGRHPNYTGSTATCFC